jgi:hypothetical protein
MRRRLACGCVVPLLFLAVLLIAVYGFGGRVVRNVIGSVTGGAVQLGALHFTPALGVDNFVLTPPDSQEPLLSFDKLSVDYHLFPEDGRYLDKVALHQPKLTLDVTPGAPPNYTFLTPSESPETPATSEPWTLPTLDWIPREALLDSGEIWLRGAQGEARLRLSAWAKLAAWEEVDASFTLHNLSWKLPGETGWTAIGLPVQLQGSHRNGRVEFFSSPENTYHVQGQLDHTANTWQGTLAANGLHFGDWAKPLAQFSPVPLQFESIGVDQLLVVGDWPDAGSPRLDNASINLNIVGLQAGSRATTGWALGSDEVGQAPLLAHLSANVAAADGLYRFHADSALGDLAGLQLNGSLADEGDAGHRVDLTLENAYLAGGLLASLPPETLPADFHLDHAQLTAVHLAGNMSPTHAALTGLRGTLSAEGLALGSLPLPEAAAPLRTLFEPAANLKLDFSEVALSKDHMALQGSVHLGEALQLTTQSTVTRAGAGWHVDAALDDVEFRTPVWSELLAGYAPLPVTFTSARLHHAAVQGAMNGALPALDQVDLDASLQGLRVGPEEAPFYAGDPHLTFKGAMPLFVPEGHARLELAPGQFLEADGRAGPAGGNLHLTLESGSRSQWSALVPPAYQPYLAYAPALETLGGTAQIEADAAGLRLKADLVPVLKQGTPATLTVEAKTDAPEPGTATSPWLAGAPGGGTAQITLALGDARAQVEARMTQADGLTLTASLQQLGPAKLFQQWMDSPALEGLVTQGTLEGTALAVPGQPLHFDFDSTWSTPAYGTYRLATENPLSAHLQGSYDLAGGQLQKSALDLHLNDDNHLKLTIDKASIGGLAAQGRLAGSLDFALLDQLLDDMELEREEGHVVLDVAFDGTPDRATLKPDVQIFTSRMRDAGLPASLPLVVRTESLALSPGDAGIAATGLTVGVEDKIAVAVSTLAAHPLAESGPQVATGPFTVEAQALPFASLFFDQCVAQASVEGTGFSYAAGQPSGAFRLSLRMDSATLSGGLAQLEGVAIDAALTFVTPETPDGPLGAWALSGAGAVRIGSMTSGGLVVRDVIGLLTVEPHEARIDITGGQFYNGLATGVLTVNLTKDTFPVSLQLDLAAVDLTTFSTEYKPPQVFITGKASGHIGVVVDLYGVLDMSGNLASDDGVTLNRDLVQTLLMRDQFTDSLGVRAVGRALDRVLGPAPQRPFSEARVEARYESGWLTLDTVLRDKAAHTLNLDITTEVDPLNLYKFLSEQQEAALAGLDSLAGPS